MRHRPHFFIYIIRDLSIPPLWAPIKMTLLRFFQLKNFTLGKMGVFDDFFNRLIVGKHGECHFNTSLFKTFIMGTDFQRCEIVEFFFCHYHILSLFPEEFFRCSFNQKTFDCICDYSVIEIRKIIGCSCHF